MTTMAGTDSKTMRGIARTHILDFDEDITGDCFSLATASVW